MPTGLNAKQLMKAADVEGRRGGSDLQTFLAQLTYYCAVYEEVRSIGGGQTRVTYKLNTAMDEDFSRRIFADGQQPLEPDDQYQGEYDD